MASSNRHWPSMFKSKPSNPTSHHYHHQWQHDVTSNSLIPATCHRTPYTPVTEERTPEPKPRWNPRPEQIRILESIFNSGIVNPPRDEIRRIRVQLQEYGQVGDANVFYWFQNRKSRSKHKQRQLQTNKPSPPPPPPTISAPPIFSPTSFSSSSSSKSPPNSGDKSVSVGSATVADLLNSPTGSVNQPFFSCSTDFLTEPFIFPVQKNAVVSTGDLLSPGFCFPDVNVSSGVANHHQSVENCSSFLLSELMLMSHGAGDQKKADEDEKLKLQTQLSYGGTTALNTDMNTVVPQSLPLTNPSSFIFHGVDELEPTKSTVFINDVCFEVGVGPFNVREAFGYDAVLIQSSGQPVLTNEWGVTLQPLQHGAFYYLMRGFTPSPDENRTIDLVMN